MSEAGDFVADVVAWLGEIDGLTAVDLDDAANAEPPFAVVGPPRMTYGGQTASPTEYSITVGLVVDVGEHAATNLLDLVPIVVERLDEAGGIVVRSAIPGELPQGVRNLPAYFIEIEVAP